MHRKLYLIFRRDPSRDRAADQIQFEGYRFYWPNGEAARLGLDALCQHGQRVLGLHRHLKERSECLLELLCYPAPTGEEPITRLPGVLVRRFYVERQGREGRIHFLNGTPTAIVLSLDEDDPRVLSWVGLTDLKVGQRQWFDLAARPVDVSTPPPASLAPVPTAVGS